MRSLISKRKSRQRRQVRRFDSRPRLERLEDRLAPAAINFDWARDLRSTTGFDNFTTAADHAVDTDGNSYLVGHFTNSVDFDPGPGVFTLTSAASNISAFVAKYSKEGNLIWAESFGGTTSSEGPAYGGAVALDGAGNIFVAGFFDKTVDFNPGTGISNLTAPGTYDTGFLLQLANDGKFVKAGAIGGNITYSDAEGLVTDKAGNIYVTGDLFATDDVDPGPGVVTITGDIFVEKLDSSWNVQWAAGIGNPDDYYTVTAFADDGEAGTRCMAVDGQGDVYINGVFLGALDFDPGAGVYTMDAGSNKLEAFVMKLNATGNFLWAKQTTGGIAKTFSYGPPAAQAQSLGLDSAGNVYVGGKFCSGNAGPVDFDPAGSHIYLSAAAPEGESDAFVWKLDSNGNVLWAEDTARAVSAGKESFQRANSAYMAVDPFGRVYTVGLFEGTVDFDPGAGTNSITSDYLSDYLSILDTNGSLLWLSSFHSVDGGDFIVRDAYLFPGFTVNLDPSGGIYLAGIFEGTTDFDPGPDTYNLTAQNVDVFLLRLVPDSLAITGLISPITVGVDDNFTVTAFDNHGQTDTAYAATVHFTSSDAGATFYDAATGQLLAGNNYTFTVSDQGQHNFRVKYSTTGVQTITAHEVNAFPNATASVDVFPPGTPTHFVVGGFPSPVTAGTEGNITVRAEDANGNLIPGYTGTVAFTSSDGQADLPLNYTFVTADAGSHAFAATLKTASIQSIKATDTVIADLSGSQTNILVNPATPNFYLTGFPSPTTAGVQGSFTVTAKDQYGNLATNYRGTVTFGSGDFQADLPPNHTFTAIDAGIYMTTATLKTAGIQDLFASDPLIGASGFQMNIQVNPGPTARLKVEGFPSPTTAGDLHSLTVTAQDIYFNTTPAYTGTVAVTSSDHQAALPANHTFNAGDAGIFSFPIALKTAGMQSLTATDTVNANLTGTESPITVNPGPTALFLLDYPSPTVAGVAHPLMIAASDLYGNRTPAYRGRVAVTSTDRRGIMPPQYQFTANDAGIYSLDVTLITAGNQSLTVTDVNAPTLQTSLPVTVVPAAANRLAESIPATVTAGDSVPVTITAFDPFNNIATGYRGNVAFTSSDSQASLPDPYSFTSDDAGLHTVSVILKTAGTQTVTAKDTANSLLTATGTTTVLPGPPATIIVNGVPSSVFVNNPENFTVEFFDAYGNVATNYTGTLHFTSSDANAILPADYTFTADDTGMHTFTAIFHTTNLQSITATDTVTGLGGSEGNIFVSKPAILSNLNPLAATEDDGEETLTVLGSQFNTDALVRWQGSPLVTTYVSSTKLLATLPAAILAEEGTFQVTAFNPGIEGGASDPIEFHVVDAALSGSPVTFNPVEATSFTGTVATFTDGNFGSSATDFSATITWGDGHTSAGTITKTGPGAFAVGGTNTYALDSTYTVNVKITDAGSSKATVANSQAVVSDAALSAQGLAITVPKGIQATDVVVATFTDAGGLEPVGNYTASIDWGDQTASSPGTITFDSGAFTITGTHTFATVGKFTDKVTILSQGGSTAMAGASAKIGSDNERYVAAAYLDVLGRGVDFPSLELWAGRLDGGFPRANFVFTLTHSGEYYSTIVTPAYHKFLGRLPDASGLAYWVGQMQKGLIDEQLEAGFIGSPEYYVFSGGTDKAWVDNMYVNLLGRLPDSQGETYWIKQLADGANRATVAHGFAASAERESQHITGNYQKYLGRLPDSGGLAFWLDQFVNHSKTNEDLIDGFVASDEYFRVHTQ